MSLFLISRFLGSGKTTLVLSLAQKEIISQVDLPVELEGYAIRVCLSFDPPIFERRCRYLAARLLEDVSRRRLESGGRLIGCVKCFAETSVADHFRGSLTSLVKGATPRTRTSGRSPLHPR